MPRTLKGGDLVVTGSQTLRGRADASVLEDRRGDWLSVACCWRWGSGSVFVFMQSFNLSRSEVG